MEFPTSLLPFIRYISLAGITFPYLFNHLFLQNEFSKSRLCERPYAFKGTSNSLLFCLFVSPFSVPFFKLLLFFLRFKELLNSGQQRSCKRVDLIVRYPRIVFLSSGHSADKFPSFVVLLSGCLFSCYPVSIFTSRFIFCPPLPLRSRFPTCLFQKCDLLHFY